MAQFSKGDGVIHAKSEQKGVIVEVKQAIRGKQPYVVMFENGSQETVLESFLRPNCDITDHFERCKRGLTASYSEFLKQNTTFKIKNSTNNTISSLKASRTMFKPYQFKPLLKFLNSPHRKLLVADEVGLGKTIEAGHIMLELKARNELTDALIICPKSLQEKWRNELHDKFALEFKVYETSKELVNDLRHGTGYVKGIINYEKIRASDNVSPDSLYSFLTHNTRNFSFILCDESHKLRNRGRQTYNGARELLQHADAAVFLSATPVMLRQEDLFNQLTLLDEEEYNNESVFKNRLAENQPLQYAIQQINSQTPRYSLPAIWETLCVQTIAITYATEDVVYFHSEKTVAEVFADNVIFAEVKKLMLGGEDNDYIRARLQYLLSSMSVLTSTFSRTRKREVTTDLSQAQRRPHRIDVTLTNAEYVLRDQLIKERRELHSGNRGVDLGLVTVKKQLASSLFAYAIEDGADISHLEDSKTIKLMEIIDEVCKNKNKKLIIFAEFIATLNYLHRLLKKHGIESVLFHGGIADRDESLNQFKNNPNIKVFLSSAAGTEGLDLQFCDSIVNFDLPWNPMVIEQRIGRVDRIGQQSQVVHIYNMVVTNSIQEKIYLRLLERIGIFESTIGDMEVILNRPVDNESDTTFSDLISDMSNDLFDENLSAEEQENKYNEIERAIENERVNMQNIEKGLENSLTFDDYFKNEINRILHNNAYVTEAELKNYVEAIVRSRMPICSLTERNTGIYTFNVPKSNPKELKNFLIDFGDKSTDEKKINTNTFIMKVDENSFDLTFSQDVAFENKGLNFINIYHPLILASLSYFEKNLDKSSTTFSFSINDCKEMQAAGKVFFLGLYKLAFTNKNDPSQKISSELYPVIYTYENGNLAEADSELAGWVYRTSQSQGMECNAPNLEGSVYDELQIEFAEKIELIADEKKKERELIEESNRQSNLEQLRIYYGSRIERDQQKLRECEYNVAIATSKEEEFKAGREIPLIKKRISDYQKEQEEKFVRLTKKNELIVSSNLLSLSCITVQ